MRGQHAQHGGDRAVHYHPFGAGGDGRTASPTGVGSGSGAFGLRRVGVGGIGSGDATFGRALHIFAGGVRAKRAGALDEFSFLVAERDSFAADTRVGRGGVGRIREVFGANTHAGGNQTSGGGSVRPNHGVSLSRHSVHRTLVGGDVNFGAGDNFGDCVWRIDTFPSGEGF